MLGYSQLEDGKKYATWQIPTAESDQVNLSDRTLCIEHDSESSSKTNFIKVNCRIEDLLGNTLDSAAGGYQVGISASSAITPSASSSARPSTTQPQPISVADPSPSVNSSFKQKRPFESLDAPHESVDVNSKGQADLLAGQQSGPRRRPKRDPVKQTARNHRRSTNKRRAERLQESGGPGGLKACHKAAAENAKAIFVEYDTPGPTPTRAFTGPPEKGVNSETFSLAQCLSPEMGMGLIKWDGKTETPILDSDYRLVGLLAGCPKGENWMKEVHDPLLEAMKDERERVSFTYDECNHRRGIYASVTGGISFGGGQIYPQNLSDMRKPLLESFDRLAKLPYTKRLAGFGNKSLMMHNPAMHQYYKETLDAICDDELSPKKPKRLFPAETSCFAACTFNLGPRTCCLRHKDFLNLEEGYCLVTNIANNDPTLGGHMVLWDLGLVIEFPPGSSIFLLSAAIEHSNLPIQEGETRCSVVQYSAGGLFRWVENGGFSDADIFAGFGDWETWKAVRRARVSSALKRLEYRF
ncbi:hypothetical protein C8J56DRAFT_371364 [Mycena floridula]|nr:hypothetical protein C8J56DRAFT_371364 [Mycena floridula]